MDKIHIVHESRALNQSRSPANIRIRIISWKSKPWQIFCSGWKAR